LLCNHIKSVFDISLNEFWTIIQERVMVFAILTKAGIKSSCPTPALATGTAAGTVAAAGPVTAATGLIATAGTLSAAAATAASSAALSRTAAATAAGLGGVLCTSRFTILASLLPSTCLVGISERLHMTLISQSQHINIDKEIKLRDGFLKVVYQYWNHMIRIKIAARCHDFTHSLPDLLGHLLIQLGLDDGG
jgi:hypothetical protein